MLIVKYDSMADIFYHDCIYHNSNHGGYCIRKTWHILYILTVFFFIEQQSNDVALLAYLGAITKSCNSCNKFMNRFNLLHERLSLGRKMRGIFFWVFLCSLIIYYDGLLSALVLGNTFYGSSVACMWKLCLDIQLYRQNNRDYARWQARCVPYNWGSLFVLSP